MTYIIKIIAMSNGDPCPVAGQYLKTFDPEAYDGQGWAETTATPSSAMHFPSAGDALNYMRTVPRSRPIRYDGETNRPLMAFTVHIVPA